MTQNKGEFKSLIALQNKFPNGRDGWYATVYTTVYIWDKKTNRWVLSNINKFTEIDTRIDNITNLTVVNNDLTLNETHHKIVCDASSNDIVITLPTAVGINGKQYIITRIDNSSNTVTIQTQIGETLYGSSSETLIQYETIDFTSDNTNYN